MIAFAGAVVCKAPWKTNRRVAVTHYETIAYDITHYFAEAYSPMLKRLIEVASPLKEVSEQSARMKSIRHGHISALHIWWARRPLAACWAVKIVWYMVGGKDWKHTATTAETE